MKTEDRPVFYDNRGIQIMVGDIVKVPHFKVGKRQYYMWKLIAYDEKLGWRGVHLGADFSVNKSYSLTSAANGYGILTDYEIVSRDAVFEDQIKTGKRLRFD